LEQAPLEAAPAILATELPRDGPRICDAVVRALADDDDLRRIEPGGALEPLVSRAGELAGAGSAETAARAVDALMAGVWGERRPGGALGRRGGVLGRPGGVLRRPSRVLRRPSRVLGRPSRASRLPRPSARALCPRRPRTSRLPSPRTATVAPSQPRPPGPYGSG